MSREEISQCFVDLCENKKINNRIALRELRKEFINWPGLLEEEGSKQAEQEEEGEGSKELVVNGKESFFFLSFFILFFFQFI